MVGFVVLDFFDTPEPGEPVFEKLNGTENFRSQRDPGPDAQEEPEPERWPEHASESRFPSHVLELLRRMVVEEHTRSGES